MRRTRSHAPLFAAASVLSVTATAEAAPVVFSSSGANAAAMTPTVNDFRNAIGGANNGNGGSFATGRREVNWEGAPATINSPNSFPGGFFNTTVPRGMVTTTPGAGTSQQVSGVSGSPGFEFDNLDAAYPTEFVPFSGQKLFTPVGTNLTDVTFFVPGTNTPATTGAFGSVFTDVDLAGATTLSFFRQDDSLLGTFEVPVADKGLSFLGVQFIGLNEAIFRVRIQTGNAVVGTADGSVPGGAFNDVVVMDDFIYAEPRQVVSAAVPEPGTLALAGLPLLGTVGAAASRRRKAHAEAA